jgi:hypothetical protein
MKKLFVFLIFGFIFSVESYGQSFQAEIADLAKRNKEWYELNTPNLVAKIPVNINGATSTQLQDGTRPNPIEQKEIIKTSEQRDRYSQEYAQIVRKYIKPPEAAEELIASSRRSMSENSTLINQLKDGKITFGDYIKARQNIVNALIERGKKIQEKYSFNLPSDKQISSQPQFQRQEPTPQKTSSTIPDAVVIPAQCSASLFQAAQVEKVNGEGMKSEQLKFLANNAFKVAMDNQGKLNLPKGTVEKVFTAKGEEYNDLLRKNQMDLFNQRLGPAVRGCGDQIAKYR